MNDQKITLKVENLNSQIVDLYTNGLYKKARELAQHAVTLAKQLGELHPLYLASLSNLAVTHKANGDYLAAESIYKIVLDIERQTMGEDHPNFAIDLNNLAGLYLALGHYLAAEPLLKQSYQIVVHSIRKEDPLYSKILNNLGYVYRMLGNYSESEKYYQQSLEIKKKTLGENDISYSIGLNNLAVLNIYMGDYNKAEHYYQQSLKIRQTVLGNNPLTATSISNLAELYDSIGNYKKSEKFFLDAKDILLSTLGDNHPQYAILLNNLGSLYIEIEQYSKAEDCYKKALEIYRDSVGINHPDYLICQNNLAELYHIIGNFSDAESLLRQTLETMISTCGKDHPSYATSINNLAGVLNAQGNYSAAESLYKEAMTIRLAKLGPNHHQYADILNNIAGLYAATGRISDAFSLMKKATDVYNLVIENIFSFGTESERLDYLNKIQGNQDMLISLILKYLSDSCEGVKYALDFILRRKAIGIEVLAHQRDEIYSGKSPEFRQKLQELSKLRHQISELFFERVDTTHLNTLKLQLEEWNNEKENIESFLAKNIPEFDLELKIKNVNRDIIAQNLPNGSALIEFIKFTEFDFEAIPSHGEKQWKATRYIAFIIKKESPEKVEMIDLGESDPIDNLIDQYIDVIKKDSASRKIRPSIKTISQSFFDIQSKIFQTILSPLLPIVGDCNHLLISPDGSLSRIPFETIPIGNNNFLIDNFQVTYVGVGRDILRFSSKKQMNYSDPLIIVDPDYNWGIDEALTKPVHESPQYSDDSNNELLPDTRKRELIDIFPEFEQLPGTRLEGEQIGPLLKGNLYFGENAVKRLLRLYQSPKIIHIATHGFFLGDLSETDKNSNPPATTQNFDGRSVNRITRIQKIHNPLLRAGLAFAGVNTWLKNKDPPLEAENGLLTAEEVTGLDLTGTELVVLSACETGLGEIRSGEGVFGFRRSFTIAGAKTLIMSLWEVPDEETRELMVNFYKGLISGKDRGVSLRMAQLIIKSKNPDPFFWGAFICQGDPGALCI